MRAPKRAPRERIAFDDATTVTARVRSHAASLGLRGSRRLVLAAVLTLLCTQWSKITDDQMRQIAGLDTGSSVFIDHHDPKTAEFFASTTTRE